MIWPNKGMLEAITLYLGKQVLVNHYNGKLNIVRIRRDSSISIRINLRGITHFVKNQI